MSRRSSQSSWNFDPHGSARYSICVAGVKVKLSVPKPLKRVFERKLPVYGVRSERLLRGYLESTTTIQSIDPKWFETHLDPSIQKPHVEFYKSISRKIPSRASTLKRSLSRSIKHSLSLGRRNITQIRHLKGLLHSLHSFYSTSYTLLHFVSLHQPSTLAPCNSSILYSFQRLTYDSWLKPLNALLLHNRILERRLRTGLASQIQLALIEMALQRCMDDIHGMVGMVLDCLSVPGYRKEWLAEVGSRDNILQVGVFGAGKGEQVRIESVGVVGFLVGLRAESVEARIWRYVHEK
ncbi:hypothetical protein BJ508DRAFT_358826 [Ascobolus immersus RN42]|uniref:Uncharacterized protein n=1 Tax=Ascobolus immersus RN42 TaxID=1160509 RepID=A0A3N4IJ59_ASCIM|nr:hypothetical protein BJ508DRAFT_358826 [Ascobolus immersus RN42]